MNKLKKVLLSIGIFIITMISKVYAIETGPQVVSMYAVDPGPRIIGETISKIGKITVPVILFFIGLFVILSKKITKKVKAIIISILLGFLVWFIMKFIAEI